MATANPNKGAIAATHKLTEASQALQRSLTGGNAAAQDQVRALKNSEGSMARSWSSRENLSQDMDKMHNSLGNLGTELQETFKTVVNPTNLLAEAIKSGISQSDQYQQGALKMGMDVNDLVGKFPGEMSTVTGGFVAAMDGTFKQTEMGMNDLGEHTSMAATRTAALGGNINGLISIQRKMETALGMDREAVDRSSKRMISLSQQYGISSDRLVGALENLSESVNTMAAMGIGEGVQDSVMELTGKFGAGNEKLIAEFTNSLMKTGSGAVQGAVLGGIQDLQTSMMQGTHTTEQMEKGILTQGNKYLTIVRRMQADGVQMNVALGQMEKLYGPGAQAAMKLAQSYEKLTPDQIAKQEKSAEIEQDWGNSLTTMKEEILTPIKVAIANNLPTIIKWGKKLMPIMQGMLKGILLVASSIAIKRGMGGMMAGMAGGDPLRAAMGMGMAGAGVAGLGLGAGVETGGGAAATVGLMAGLLPMAATLFSKDKGAKGAFEYGFGPKGGESSLGAAKLGSAANPMHVRVVGGGMGGEMQGPQLPDGVGRGLKKGLSKFSNTKWGKRLQLDKLGKLVSKIPGMGGKGVQIAGQAAQQPGMFKKAGQMVGKVFGKTGVINKAGGALVRGAAKSTQIAGKGIGGVMKKWGGKTVVSGFGKIVGKRLAAAAALQVIPFAGQAIGGIMLAWTAVEVGLFAWRMRKEKRAGEMEEAISKDLHERQQARIQDEINQFNKGMQESTSFLRISNTELRGAMRQAIGGRSQAAALERVANASEAALETSRHAAAAQEETADNTKKPLTGAED